MNQNTYAAADFERDIEEIDEAIFKHNKIVENLRFDRFELLAQKSNCELEEVFEYAVDSGFTSSEIMELIISAIPKKKERNSH